MQTFKPGDSLRFDYGNHRGVVETRTVVLVAFDFGSNEWYPERQWFLRCWDGGRQAYRSFALRNIIGDVEVL